MRNLLILTLLCSLPTILGCSQSVVAGKVPVAVAPANTQDLAPVRCPPVDAATVAELKSLTPTPTDAGVTKRGSQQWLDNYELAEKRKNGVGQSLIREYQRCRSGGSAGPLDTVAKALGTS